MKGQAVAKGNTTMSNQSTQSNLLQAYKNAILHPDVETYREEAANASWQRIWVSLAIAGIAGLAFDLIQFGGSNILWLFFDNSVGMFIGFFVFALLLYGIARYIAGVAERRSFSQIFTTHAYLLALVITPSAIVNSLLSLVPGVAERNIIILLALLPIGLYGLYLIRNTLQASFNLEPSQATRAVNYFILLLIVVTFIVAFGYVTLNVLLRTR